MARHLEPSLAVVKARKPECREFRGEEHQPGGLARGFRVNPDRSLTHDVGVVDLLQELRLLVETLLVDVLLLAGTFAVDLLDGPRRRIQLVLPGIQRSEVGG